MKRYIKSAETVYDTSEYGGEKYAYITYDSVNGKYRVYDVESDRLVKTFDNEDKATDFYERYVSECEYNDIMDEKRRRTFDERDEDDIYDYFYKKSISEGHSESYADKIANDQAGRRFRK